MTTKPDQDKIYISLLGLAEHFRSTSPPDIKKCIQCLQALFTFMPPTKVVARTHLQMGQVLLDYTQSLELARHHLEQAVRPFSPFPLDLCTCIRLMQWNWIFSSSVVFIRIQFTVATVRERAKLWWCEIRCGQFNGPIISGAEPECYGKASTSQSTTIITTQCLLAL